MHYGQLALVSHSGSWLGLTIACCWWQQGRVGFLPARVERRCCVVLPKYFRVGRKLCTDISQMDCKVNRTIQWPKNARMMARGHASMAAVTWLNLRLQAAGISPGRQVAIGCPIYLACSKYITSCLPVTVWVKWPCLYESGHINHVTLVVQCPNLS